MTETIAETYTKFRDDAQKYADARDMTLEDFVDYCVRLYIDTTPEDPDDVGDVGYE